VIFTVTPKRWEHGWELHVAGVGCTQSETLFDAEETAREYIEIRLGLLESAVFDVEFAGAVGESAVELQQHFADLYAAQKVVDE
jgi:hypothetical protein